MLNKPCTKPGFVDTFAVADEHGVIAIFRLLSDAERFTVAQQAAGIDAQLFFWANDPAIFRF